MKTLAALITMMFFCKISFCQGIQLYHRDYYGFTSEDSIKCSVLNKDWRGNLYKKFKVPDTAVVNIKIFDSSGYVKRIKAYRLVGAQKYVVAQGDSFYVNSSWTDLEVSFLTMEKIPIKEQDIDQSFF